MGVFDKAKDKVGQFMDDAKEKPGRQDGEQSGRMSGRLDDLRDDATDTVQDAKDRFTR